MDFSEYAQYDGLGLAELVKSGQVQPLELVEAAIAAIERFDPQLNALTYKAYAFARESAQELEQHPLPAAPFAGVPFLLKDLRCLAAGMPTSHGNRLMRDRVAPHDCEMVRRFKQSGAIILGKTNTPEVGLSAATEPELFGPTHNPWQLDRSPGGSSGGSAAAVAARLVPIASGSDGGGSLRIPASCCGVFAMKPTRGRTPTGPDMGEVWRGLAIGHVLSRSVRDNAAMLDAISGPEVGAPYQAPTPARAFLTEVTAPPGQLRIAFSSRPLVGNGPVHPDCQTGLQQTATLLEELGHELVEAAPPVEAEAFAVAFLTVVACELRADIERVAALIERKPRREDFEAATYVLGLLGKATPAVEYAQVLRYLQTAARAIGEFFEDFDVLLTPTLAQPPIQIGGLQPQGLKKLLVEIIGRAEAGWLLRGLNAVKSIAQQSFDYTPYTIPFNVTGQPAMSVPLHWSEAGLPIGMQFAGRFVDEATLFRLAGQLERLKPWEGKTPPILDSVHHTDKVAKAL
ncbi:MAG: amidase [Cyanobacteria bacterium J06641_5]